MFSHNSCHKKIENSPSRKTTVRSQMCGKSRIPDLPSKSIHISIKTSALLALKDDLNASGEFRCAYVNVEIGQAAREDVAAAMRAILSALGRAARHTLDDLFVSQVWPGILDGTGPNDALGETLARWAESDAREQLIRRRETHLDQLTDKLQEERVRRVIEPLLSGRTPRAL